MSRASARVKFPDGTIKHTVYNGTMDVYWRPLFNTPKAAWDAWREYYSDKLDDSKWLNSWDDGFYDVQISDDYGGGTTYIGRASKSQIVSAIDTDRMNLIKRGRADWWHQETSTTNDAPGLAEPHAVQPEHRRDYDR
jgi:hypothetical protein